MGRNARRKLGSGEILLTNDDLIAKLIADGNDYLEHISTVEEFDSEWDYLCGLIDRNASILRFLGVDEKDIPERNEE